MRCTAAVLLLALGCTSAAKIRQDLPRSLPPNPRIVLSLTFPDGWQTPIEEGFKAKALQKDLLRAGNPEVRVEFALVEHDPGTQGKTYQIGLRKAPARLLTKATLPGYGWFEFETIFTPEEFARDRAAILHQLGADLASKLARLAEPYAIG